MNNHNNKTDNSKDLKKIFYEQTEREYPELSHNLNKQIEDMRHTMSLFKSELVELIKTYIDPWLE